MSRGSNIERTAFHEAGHVIAALRLRRAFKKVSIIPNAESSGRVVGYYEWAPIQYIEKMNFSALMRMANSTIIIDYCGIAAVEKYNGQRDWSTAEHDQEDFINIAESICCNSEAAKSYLDELWIESVRLVNDPVNWADIETVANALMQEKELSRRKIVGILKGNKRE